MKLPKTTVNQTNAAISATGDGHTDHLKDALVLRHRLDEQHVSVVHNIVPRFEAFQNRNNPLSASRSEYARPGERFLFSVTSGDSLLLDVAGEDRLHDPHYPLVGRQPGRERRLQRVQRVCRVSGVSHGHTVGVRAGVCRSIQR